MFYIGLAAAFFISLIYSVKKRLVKELFLFWYIVFLPTTKLFPDVNIPGFRFEILFGMCFLVVDFFSSKSLNLRKKILYKETYYARVFLILQIIFLTYSTLLDVLFPVDNNVTTISDFIIPTIRYSLIILIFLRISYSLYDLRVRRVIIFALFTGLCLLGFSSFFYQLFSAIGVNTGRIVYDEDLGKNVLISTGLFRGHPTQFAGIFRNWFRICFCHSYIFKKIFS